MKRFQLIIALTLFTSYTFGQKLIVVDSHTKRKRKIKIGKVMTVTTKIDSTEADPFHYYKDSTLAQGYYCPDGCFRLVSINVKDSSFVVANELKTILKEFSFNDVKFIAYVRVKHPHTIFAIRVGLATLGFISILGRTVTINDSDSDDKKITDYLIGTTMIGLSMTIRSNVSRTYKLIGIEN